MSRVDESFDPRLHEMCDHKRFDELKVGDRFVHPSRTIGGENFAALSCLNDSGYVRALKTNVELPWLETCQRTVRVVARNSGRQPGEDEILRA